MININPEPNLHHANHQLRGTKQLEAMGCTQLRGQPTQLIEGDFIELINETGTLDCYRRIK
jgi:hypothetical protein